MLLIPQIFIKSKGLCIDRKVTLLDLKGVLDHFLRETFGNKVQTRLRPSFFPFTEPSFEVDLKAPNLGKLSDKWIEIMGCGLVDPEFLKLVNLICRNGEGLPLG